MFGSLFRIEAKPGKRQELVDFLRWDGEIGRDQEPGVTARDVPLRQPDGVPLLPPDRDLVPDEGDDSRLPLVVGDDQLVHAVAITRRLVLRTSRRPLSSEGQG